MAMYLGRDRTSLQQEECLAPRPARPEKDLSGSKRSDTRSQSQIPHSFQYAPKKHGHTNFQVLLLVMRRSQYFRMGHFKMRAPARYSSLMSGFLVHLF